MKKSAATLLALLTSLTLHALPIGNPWDATFLKKGLFLERYPIPFLKSCNASWNLRVGFYGDYVFNRRTEVDVRERRDSIHSTKIFTNAGFLALNFCNHLDLFTTLGATGLQFETRANVVGVALPSVLFHNDPVWFDTDTRFSWSVGLRGTLWERKCFILGAEAQYFHTSPHLNFIRGEEDDPFYFSSHSHARYQEWQIGFAASYRVNIISTSTALVPYIGVKWDRVHLTFDHAVAVTESAIYTLPNLQNQQSWGYAVGLTLLGGEKATVTVEGRFANEEAVYVNSQFRF